MYTNSLKETVHTDMFHRIFVVSTQEFGISQYFYETLIVTLLTHIIKLKQWKSH